jgi:hypothetical protein
MQAPPRYHREQAAALLQLKGPFTFTASSCQSYPANTTLSPWRADTDCCRWEGDNVTGKSAEAFIPLSSASPLFDPLSRVWF